MAPGWTRGIALTAAYTATAIASLQLASIHFSSSPVWPPSGLAIGALALWGLRMWPAVYVGAFAANAWTSGHWESSLLIAAGNAAEAAAGAWILRHFLATDIGARIHHVGVLVVAAAAGATLSAGTGVASLLAWDLLPRVAAPAVAGTWWLGNVAGTLIVAPLLLAWHRPGRHDAGILVAAVGGALLAFQGTGTGLVLLLPVAFWAVRHASGLAMPMAMLGWAIGGVAMTRAGQGPFWGGEPNEALLLLQVFLIFLALSGLVLAAEHGSRRTRSAPWVASGVTAFTFIPLLAGALFIGTTLHPALADLYEGRQDELQDGVTDAWSDIVEEQGTQLETLRAFFEAADVDSASFREYVESTGWTFGPGRSTAIGYAPIVPHGDVPDFEAAVRADLDLPAPVRENFSVFPATDAPFHAPVRHVYPMDPQPGAIGFDLYLDDVRSASLYASAEIGRPVASAPVEIVRPGGNATGMMLALPVERGGNTVGYVISATALPDAASAPPAPQGTVYRVVDATADEQVLFASGDAEWNGATLLEAWERRWRIDFATPPLATTTEAAAPWFILASSGILSAAFGMVVFAYDSSRDKAVRLGKEMAAKARTEEQQAATIRQLEELDAFRRRFLNMASHELRTPLTPILSHTHILSLTASPEQRISVEALERGAKRLNAVVDDLLTAARAEADELHLDLGVVDLAGIVEESVAAHQEAAEQAGAHIQLHAVATPVLADARRLAQIADNLLTNAIKFAPGGHIHVTVATEGSPVLRVQDDGHGIDPAQLPLMGQPFMQAPDSPGGSGLGLYICKTLARLHGGELEIASDGLGKGTTITVRLTEPAPT